ncbi:hypothetical protein PLICRDRAFT_42358 [Plicaturopsis crispa FD-325 SS-3]|nr:hypothetical protein PLICRDRAFT_42358 [Plicaturopsis crispa FD-325 SS-3]
MFPASIQPGTVSLFSSSSSDPLSLFATHTDPFLPLDSFIHLLHDTSSEPLPPSPAVLTSLPPGGHTLDQRVLHIQSPTLPSTYIQCPARYGKGRDLGMKHPWIHIQMRDIGREWSFEVGLVDHAGKLGVVRCSTFQKQPRLKITSPPLLHLPLSFPSPSSNPLTSWATIALHLPPLLRRFTSVDLVDVSIVDHAPQQFTPDDTRSNALPSGTYSHVAYVKIYANCRLRRIWFSETGPAEKLPWEFELYGVD